MNLKTGIQKAIDGGWRKKDNITDVVVFSASDFIALIGEGGTKYPELAPAEILLDPEFWKALGKTENWQSDHVTSCSQEWLKKW